MFSKNGIDLDDGSRCLRGAAGAEAPSAVEAGAVSDFALAARGFLVAGDAGLEGAASAVVALCALSSVEGKSLAMMKPQKMMEQTPLEAQRKQTLFGMDNDQASC